MYTVFPNQAGLQGNLLEGGLGRADRQPGSRSLPDRPAGCAMTRGFVTGDGTEGQPGVGLPAAALLRRASWGSCAAVTSSRAAVAHACVCLSGSPRPKSADESRSPMVAMRLSGST